MPTTTPGTELKMSVPGETLKPTDEVTLVESGTITGFHDDVASEPWRHRADTSRRLAYILAGLLALSFFAHYGATVAFIAMGKLDAAILKDIFSLWVPVISALTGAAVTYYFTRRSEK